MPRALLGIATGNDMVGEYMNAVVNDLGALLDWKINRVRPTTRSKAKTEEETATVTDKLTNLTIKK